MSEPALSGKEKYRALSGDKAELVKLLLERQLRQNERIAVPQQTVPLLRPSSAQERMWFIDRMGVAGSAYHIAVVLRMRGPLECRVLQLAFSTIVARHDSLRSVFPEEEGSPKLEVLSCSPLDLRLFDLSAMTEEAREEQMRRHKLEEMSGRFDLGTGPLIRARLLRLHCEDHVLLVTMHHIISDGWSVALFLTELANVYAAHQLGDAQPGPIPTQYLDYAQWQRQRLEGPLLDRQLGYWKARLAGASDCLELPTDRARPAVQSFRGGSCSFELDAKLLGEVKALARRHGMTLFMVLCAGWAALLFRLSGQQDLLIGTPVANRQLPELRDVIGLFVNTLVLRVSLASKLCVRELLTQVKSVALEAYEHQDTPFEKIVEAVRPQRNMSQHPLFQVMFALQNTPDPELRFPGLSATLEEGVEEPTTFDLLLTLTEKDIGMTGLVNFAADLFELDTIERWMEHYTVLLSAMVEDEKRPIGKLPILTDAQTDRLLSTFNDTGVAYPRALSIEDIFERRAADAPDAVAIVYKDLSATYACLDRGANRLAWFLWKEGARASDYVALLMPRCPEMVIAQLAILKCGAVYVPVDPELPPERQKFIVEDCAARLVLTTLARGVPPPVCHPGRFHYWDDIAPQLSAMPERALGLTVDSGSAAYVMYTSGSTGIPKGVMVPHRAVIRLVINAAYCRVGPHDRTAYCSNPTFDASTFEVWAALLNGASISIIPNDVVLDAARLIHVLQDTGVSILWLTAGLFTQYAEDLPQIMGQLRYFLTGGDVVKPEIVGRMLRVRSPQHFLDGYGPTECTTFSTSHEVRAGLQNGRAIPIGRPLSNTRIHILDAERQVVPIGVAGEIFIAGDGLALGYLSQPALTAERFVASPFARMAGERMYKTGDLGRWRSDGEVEYLGRNDHQVKLRGFRIEPGEIEAHILRHEQVAKAEVLVRQYSGGDKRLVAYIVPRRSAEATARLDVTTLKAHLRGSLPTYMVPHAFVILEEFPLTPTGKVDRNALPAPGLSSYSSAQYEPPQDFAEHSLGKIWEELLGLPSIGRRDNFFELGGHSLLALKVLYKVNTTFGSGLNVTDLYRHPTIAELAGRLRGGAREEPLVDLSQEAVLDPAIVPLEGLPSAGPREILLTGATGFVGRFLLWQLLTQTGSRVHCLVRSRSVEEATGRLQRTMESWHLWSSEFQDRVLPLCGDLSLPLLGLEAEQYDGLCRDVGAIYHCATSMNHLETYATARRPNVEGSRELLKMATRGRPKLINHISTLSVFSESARGCARVIDEDTPIDHERHRFSAGYAASKWVSERLFRIAQERGIPCNIFRLGLVWADTLLGRYDPLQREDRIFHSALISGMGIRDYRFETPPTPVDFVVRAVTFLAGRHLSGGGTFHLSSPMPLEQGLFERCNALGATAVELLPHREWVAHMRRLHEAGQVLPAAPLLDLLPDAGEGSNDLQEQQAPGRQLEFTSDRTLRELADGGIKPPALDDALLKIYAAARSRA